MDRYELSVDHPRLRDLELLVADIRASVIDHPFYRTVLSRAALQRFMEYHVFAVWDFMSLLKQLQQNLTCVSAPWVPVGYGASRRLINEIVLVEESDAYEGGYLSHFELYRLAMAQAGADERAIVGFLEQLKLHGDVGLALDESGAPDAAATFVRTTFQIIQGAPIHAQAAAFAFGREYLIHPMFQQLTTISAEEGLTHLYDYLDRHVAVDGEEHTPMAMQLLIDLCGDDATRWDQCVETVRLALDARCNLWDTVADVMPVRV